MALALEPIIFKLQVDSSLALAPTPAIDPIIKHILGDQYLALQFILN